MKKEIYLSLGSNLGDRVRHLEDALGQVGEELGSLGKVSGIYESEPWGYSSDHSFCNCCISVHTKLEPLTAQETIIRIEKGMGRERSSSDKKRKGYTDRIIDIDLLLYGDRQYDHPRLVLPHPALADRRFVLLPLNEIAPRLVHPVLGISIARMLELCSDPGEVWLYREA
jgi:2-amino-4-hydroxy-6-hydroxymethyldihydropteridine diphosphokinase